ncbi:MAG: hypothetical protein JNG89_19620 [Planctomycetaceae bacterium]|nr:hypothetical protein [Planctomycetaceae bacterium]
MLNQSTINGTRFVDGAVIATVICPVVADVRFDRAGSQPKHLGKRLHQRRLPALRMRYASAAAASYSAQPAAAAAESWRMRMPASQPGSRSAAAPAELPASAWASLVLSRAV